MPCHGTDTGAAPASPLAVINGYAHSKRGAGITYPEFLELTRNHPMVTLSVHHFQGALARLEALVHGRPGAPTPPSGSPPPALSLTAPTLRCPAPCRLPLPSLSLPQPCIVPEDLRFLTLGHKFFHKLLGRKNAAEAAAKNGLPNLTIGELVWAKWLGCAACDRHALLSADMRNTVLMTSGGALYHAQKAKK